MAITKVPLTKAAMRKEIPAGDEPLVDTTASLLLRSKRLERLQKKRHQKEAASKQYATFLDLPSELILNILSLLRPSDIFTLSQVNHGLQNFILKDASRIAGTVIAERYSILTRCFPLPVLLENVDKEAHSALLDNERQAKHLQIHKKPYQHVQTPDPRTICTCLTCMLTWNNLCLLVDFAHWQQNLEQGEPIPMVPRGKNPKWNQTLISANAAVVQKALYNTLWYARILEQHLKSIVGSIRRHGNNAGNKRRRFRMTVQDAATETDAFLSRSRPPSMDFPFHRDSYYMLEAYLPNRGWNSEVNGWVYMPATQHDRDVEFVKTWAKRRREVAAEAKELKEVS
ncbi:uncharacterized protein K444DRAFT_607085 [Hyaloscypha bicolor E]|uniref:F-box domain-containing protein n=1 Tax=Hyaloscypha bicolor E TaxID=1095630 RepID=A0A2J6TV02_9HELO|nr:uncharacterized protein K444DRAFT_607085 [Hyaloscypha bicolor E]PMD66788.1 hypothetical protein K444DRAFT_607085 [Hyaloscypha bicolor E]